MKCSLLCYSGTSKRSILKNFGRLKRTASLLTVETNSGKCWIKCLLTENTMSTITHVFKSCLCEASSRKVYYYWNNNILERAHWSFWPIRIKHCGITALSWMWLLLWCLHSGSWCVMRSGRSTSLSSHCWLAPYLVTCWWGPWRTGKLLGALSFSKVLNPCLFFPTLTVDSMNLWITKYPSTVFHVLSRYSAAEWRNYCVCHKSIVVAEYCCASYWLWR